MSLTERQADQRCLEEERAENLRRANSSSSWERWFVPELQNTDTPLSMADFYRVATEGLRPKVMWGSFNACGFWQHNPHVAMTPQEQAAENFRNGFDMTPRRRHYLQQQGAVSIT